MSKLPVVIQSKATRLTKGLPISPNVALDSFNMLVQAHRDYKQTVEIEKTKRATSEAWRDVNVARLENQREILQSYLKDAFAERRHTIDEMFSRLDEGMASGNLEVVNMAMQGIVNIVQSSPLKEAEKILQAMNDPNVQHIEF